MDDTFHRIVVSAADLPAEYTDELSAIMSAYTHTHLKHEAVKHILIRK